jgi:hypothetical protein
MKNWPYLFLIAAVLSVSCKRESQKKVDNTSLLKESESSYNATHLKLIESIKFIAEPLQELNDEQMASVAALLHITRVIAHDEYTQNKSRGITDQYWQEIRKVCSPLPILDLSKGGCLDVNIGYAVSMARCLEDGTKNIEECERESSGDLATVINCHMTQIEELPQIIRKIEGRDWQGHPFPWPGSDDVDLGN